MSQKQMKMWEHTKNVVGTKYKCCGNKIKSLLKKVKVTSSNIKNVIKQGKNVEELKNI